MQNSVLAEEDPVSAPCTIPERVALAKAKSSVLLPAESWTIHYLIQSRCILSRATRQNPKLVAEIFANPKSSQRLVPTPCVQVTRRNFTILVDPIYTAPTKHKTTRAETQNQSLPCLSPTPHQIEDPLTISFSPSDKPSLTDKLNLSNPDFYSKGVGNIQKLDPTLEKLDKTPEQAEQMSPLKTESPVVHNERTSVINCFQDSSPQKIIRETAVLLSPSQAADTIRNSSLVVFTGSRLSAPTENHADPNSRQSTRESARKSQLFLLERVPKFKDLKSHYEKVIRFYNLERKFSSDQKSATSDPACATPRTILKPWKTSMHVTPSLLSLRI